MNDSMIDLRSDTVTQPTAEMRAAMAAAEVGDDVYMEDPTVNRLQERAAEIFRKPAALFVPSGTMGNQIAIRFTRARARKSSRRAGRTFTNLKWRPWLRSAGFWPARFPRPDGILDWDSDPPGHSSEDLLPGPNRSDRAGKHAQHGGRNGLHEGADRRYLPPRARSRIAGPSGRRARFSMPRQRSERDVASLAQDCDSVMFCLSKGLSAPVGSMLVGIDGRLSKGREACEKCWAAGCARRGFLRRRD